MRDFPQNLKQRLQPQGSRRGKSQGRVSTKKSEEAPNQDKTWKVQGKGHIASESEAEAPTKVKKREVSDVSPFQNQKLKYPPPRSRRGKLEMHLRI